MAPTHLHVIHQDIYEPKGAGPDYPVLRHTFFGKTAGEARRYFKAHMKTDAFMRACTNEGKFDSIICPVKEGTMLIHEVPPLSGAAEAPKKRPYLVLGILGVALLGGAALMYRNAKRGGR